MAFLTMNSYSNAIGTKVEFNVIQPKHKKKAPDVGALSGSYQTLWLLHGLLQDRNDWVCRASVERYADHYGIAAVMRSAGLRRSHTY